MQMNDSQSALHIPLWLTVALVFLLTGRTIIFYKDQSTLSKSNGIRWHELSALSMTEANSQPKLVLYSFTADWSRPCKLMERTTYLNREIISLINQNFFAIKIIDKIDKKTQVTVTDKFALQMENKYDIFNLPQLIVTLPSGKKVDDRSAYLSISSLKDFLGECEIKALYTKGLTYLADGKYSQAAQSFDSWLKQSNANSYYISNGYLYCALAYKMASEDKKAMDILSLALEKCYKIQDDKVTKSIIDFLMGRINEDQLIQQMESEPFNLAKARYFTGMMKLKNGNVKAGKIDFQFILEKHASYSDTDFLANGQLKLIELKSR